MGGDSILSFVKTVASKFYRGALFIGFLAFMLLSVMLLFTFLANPEGMIEHVKHTFGIGG
ncbi:hypothetical protein SAMN04487866_101567 [Thermoactinomyces sp. DSM 45891]|nr:hypothetical protein SAMN04487866_101567 [Thermoactinomyces sp. DSM 45891]